MSQEGKSINDEGRVVAEFTDKEGFIIRVGMSRGIITETRSSCRYANKFVTDVDIENVYIKAKNAFKKRMKDKSTAYRKFVGNFMEFEDFRKFMIYKYRLIGIEYKDNKLLCDE
jgi:ABC-type proline/glycine betaine transport system ATPase subunit